MLRSEGPESRDENEDIPLGTSNPDLLTSSRDDEWEFC